jgi:hypothetical protein
MAGLAQPTDPKEITLARLDNQIKWYGRKSGTARRVFKTFKIIEILAAALIPFFTGLKFKHFELIVGSLGVLITILEGILQLYQFQQIWTVYRATCEALIHEKFLFLAFAGPYAGVANPPQLLAERIEAIMSQENAKWVSLQEQQQSQKADGAGR